MATQVIMPALGMAQDTGRLVGWLRAEGSSVAQGDPLMEIETDKSRVEVEAPASGVVAGVRVHPDEEVAVGTVLAWILAPGETVPSTESTPPTPTAPGSTARSAAPSPPLAVGGTAAPGASQRPLASPLARRLAAERGLELAGRAGTGPGGAVVAADVTAPGPVTAGSGGEPGPLARQMAEHTTRVWTTTPHFYLSRDVRARRLRDWREAVRRRSGLPVTYTDLLLRVAGKALAGHREMLGYWDGGGLRHHPAVHVGLAVSTPRGLLVVVVRDVPSLDLPQLVAAREAVVARAQAGRLRAADVEGAVLTISNLGMHGVDRFGAVLPEEQSAILAVGRVRDAVVPVDGRAAVEPILSLTLSCDHRVLDGVQAATFLGTLCESLEEPALLLDAMAAGRR